ncbi:hypothetical protein DFH09DRAFT_1462738 [Mycena vulgaris]|nr:hypothetical protein DFH09DRAFT_1462738 [Mycena vulgaris]
MYRLDPIGLKVLVGIHALAAYSTSSAYCWWDSVIWLQLIAHFGGPEGAQLANWLVFAVGMTVSSQLLFTTVYDLEEVVISHASIIVPYPDSTQAHYIWVQEFDRVTSRCTSRATFPGRILKVEKLDELQVVLALGTQITRLITILSSLLSLAGDIILTATTAYFLIKSNLCLGFNLGTELHAEKMYSPMCKVKLAPLKALARSFE